MSWSLLGSADSCEVGCGLICLLEAVIMLSL
jgi:hypothetical protein